MKIFDTLYTRDSKGRINEWEIHLVSILGAKGTYYEIVINEGLIDGNSTTTTRKVEKGKNIGKMNETSIQEQAESEAQSRWEKKKKQGYKSLEDLDIRTQGTHYHIVDTNDPSKGIGFEILKDCLEQTLPKDRTDANNISKPMKAQPYFKDNGDVRIKFPCYGQPKLNGFRVMARWETVKENQGTLLETEVEKVVFRSKEGLRYDILEHIEEEFHKEMFFPSNGNDERVYDGEMYIHGEILSEISSAVRKRNSKTIKLKFNIFDIAINNLTQEERIWELQELQNYILESGKKNIIVIESEHINTNEEAQNHTDMWITQGYEGGIFRDRKAFYEFGKRPQTMTKLKRSEDKEFYIIDVVGGDNSPELGIFVCRAENGEHFKCTPEGTSQKKREYLSNKQTLIGKMLTVRFFERTKDNLPFHAVGVAIRNYE